MPKLVANFFEQTFPISPHLFATFPHISQSPQLMERVLMLFIVTSKQWAENGNLQLMIIDFQTCSNGLLGKRSPHLSTFSNTFPHLPTLTVGKTHAIAF